MTVSFADIKPSKKILEARRYPIHECLINEGWREDGIASIMLTRSQPDGNLLFAVYVVDVFCLGLKSTDVETDVDPEVYRTELAPGALADKHLVACSPELAHQIIYGGIDYAAQYGFKPDKDFHLSRHVLEERDKIVPGEVVFGSEGKPFMLPGLSMTFMEFWISSMQGRAKGITITLFPPAKRMKMTMIISFPTLKRLYGMMKKTTKR